MALAGSRRNGYLIAVLGTAAAVAVQQSLAVDLGRYALLMLFIVPVIGAAWLGGMRAGLAATLLGLAGSTLCAAQAEDLQLGDLVTQVRIGAFVIVGMLLSWLLETLHGYRYREMELQQRTQQLAARLQAVLDSIPHQIFAIDADCRYTYLSDTVLDVTGKRREQVLGRTIWEVFPETLGTEFETRVRGAVATRTACSFDFLYAQLGRWIDVHVHPSAIGTVLVVADITARKAIEHSLASRQELLQSIIDNIPVMITVFDAQGREPQFNREFERLTGWTAADAVEGRLLQRCYPDPEYRGRIRQLMHDCTPGWSEVRVRTRAGADLLTSWAALRLSDGRRIGIGLDLSELRNADVAQARLAALVESSGDAIIGKTTQGVITSWNASAARLFGHGADDAVGRPITLIVPPDRLDEERAILARIARGEKVPPFETVRVDRAGRPVEVSLVVSPVRDRSGSVVGAATVARDIGERKRNELALQRSEAMLRDFFDNAAVGLHWIGADGVILRANRAELQMLGYAETEYVGHNLAEFHVEKLAAGEFLRRLTAGQTIHDYEARLRCRDGSIRHVLLSCNVLREDGRFVHARCFTRDITDRKRAEQRLQSMLRLTERLNATLEIEVLLDSLVRETQLLVGADSGCAGLRTAQGLECTRYFDKGEFVPIDRRFAPGEGLAGWVLMHKQPYLTNDAAADRQIVPDLRERFGVTCAAAVPILGTANQVLGFLQMHNKPGGFDAQDRDLLVGVSRAASVAMQNALAHRTVVAAEESLREADRRKDEFLATLAHELRNPLAPIRNAVELFRTKRGLDADLLWGHEVIQRQVEQLAHLVDDLLDMSRVSRGLIELRRGPLPVAAIVNTALETSRPLIEANGHFLEVALDDEKTLVNGDLTRLAQVLSNLLNNAAKYTPPGGRIRVSTQREGQSLVLRVVDSGIGIPRSMLSRIFDLFAQVDRSLERTTGGLGIGLSLVRRLVELHGGTVEAHSAGPGKGSEFVVQLPLAAADAVRAPLAEPPAIFLAPDPAAAGRRILVVDDNRDSANSLAMLLRVLGHQVDVAHDGIEAVRMAAALHPEVVLLDIGLPKLNGYDAARRMRQMPWARSALLVAVTGWGQDEDRKRSRESGFDSHLVKPVDLAALQELLAMQAVAAAPAGPPAGGRVTH